MSGGHHGAFPVTDWSEVARAGEEDGAGLRPCLGKLLEDYLPALKTHLLLRLRIAPDQADDLLQGFVADKILQQQLLARADRRKGRFRTFLLTVLDHYVFDQLRGAKRQTLGLEAALTTPTAAPDQTFHRAWAREVLAHAVQRMRQECEASGRADIWGVFECRVLATTLDQDQPAGYEEVVARFGFASPIQAGNALTTAKRMFARILRRVVGEYAAEEEIEEEIAELKKILSGGA